MKATKSLLPLKEQQLARMIAEEVAKAMDAMLDEREKRAKA